MLGNSKTRLKIGIMGDFDGRMSHLATNAAIEHVATQRSFTAEIKWIGTEEIDKDIQSVRRYDALLCAPGTPYKNLNGALKGIQFARQNNIPFLGTCGGCQHAILEFARNALDLADVEHAEVNPNAKNALITPLSCSMVGVSSAITLKEKSKSNKAYGTLNISEKFRCGFGLNHEFLHLFSEKGLVISGTDEKGEPVVFELQNHPFFVGTLFQPQLSSLPEAPHPLIVSFLEQTILLKKDFQIRSATEDEATILTDLAMRSKAYWPYDRDFLQKCRPALEIDVAAIADGLVHVITNAGQILGYYAFSRSKEIPDMVAFFVDPKWIGKGLGNKLWNHAVEFCRAQKWTFFQLEADPYAAEKFYYKVGCKKIGEVESTVKAGRMLPLLRFDCENHRSDLGR
jgi:GNAT superfamily N-acetyltransferase